MELDERPTARDVVLYKTLPNEMPRVAGIITEVTKTPLSHVNLLITHTHSHTGVRIAAHTNSMNNGQAVLPD